MTMPVESKHMLSSCISVWSHFIGCYIVIKSGRFSEAWKPWI